MRTRQRPALASTGLERQILRSNYNYSILKAKEWTRTPVVVERTRGLEEIILYINEKACADAHSSSSNYDFPSCAPITWGYTSNKGQNGTIVLQAVLRGRIQEPLLHWDDKFTQSDDIRYSCTPSLLELLLSTLLESAGPKLPALPR